MHHVLQRGISPPFPPPCSLAHTVEEFLSRLHLQMSQWPLSQTPSALLTPQSLYGTLLKQPVSGSLRRMPTFPQLFQ